MRKFVSMFLVVLTLVSCMSVTAFASDASPVHPLSDAPAMNDYVQKIGGVTFSNVVKYEEVKGYDYNSQPMDGIVYKVTLGVGGSVNACMKSTSNNTDFMLWRDGFNAPKIKYQDIYLKTGGVMEQGFNRFRNLGDFGITSYADEANAKGQWIGGLVWEFDTVENKTYNGQFNVVYYVTAVVDGQTYNYMLVLTNRPDYKNETVAKPSGAVDTTVPAPATNVKAQPTPSKVFINGKEVAFEAYNINGNNYFKLRDVALALRGTEKQFEVVWDPTIVMEIQGKTFNGGVSMYSKKPYTTVGGEMKKGDGVEKDGVLTTSPIILDGRLITPTAYNIKGNNFFKLRDLGDAFDFNVSWDGNLKAVVVNTSESYDPTT